MATKSKSKSPAQEPTACAKELKGLIKKKIGSYATFTQTTKSYICGGTITYVIEVTGACESFKFVSKSKQQAMTFLIAGLKTLKDVKGEIE